MNHKLYLNLQACNICLLAVSEVTCLTLMPSINYTQEYTRHNYFGVFLFHRPFGAQIRPFLEMMQGPGGAGGHAITELQRKD